MDIPKKKRAVDIEGDLILALVPPKYYYAFLNAGVKMIERMYIDNIDKSDILLALHEVINEVEFAWRFLPNNSHRSCHQSAAQQLQTIEEGEVKLMDDDLKYWTPEKRDGLRVALDTAKSSGHEVFHFEGSHFVSRYAEYLLEYLDGIFSEGGEDDK